MAEAAFAPAPEPTGLKSVRPDPASEILSSLNPKRVPLSQYNNMVTGLLSCRGLSI